MGDNLTGLMDMNMNDFTKRLGVDPKGTQFANAKHEAFKNLGYYDNAQTRIAPGGAGIGTGLGFKNGPSVNSGIGVTNKTGGITNENAPQGQNISKPIGGIPPARTDIFNVGVKPNLGPNDLSRLSNGALPTPTTDLGSMNYNKPSNGLGNDALLRKPVGEISSFPLAHQVNNAGNYNLNLNAPTLYPDNGLQLSSFEPLAQVNNRIDNATKFVSPQTKPVNPKQTKPASVRPPMKGVNELSGSLDYLLNKGF